jgi:hypothetical protein
MRSATLENRRAWEHIRRRGGVLTISVKDCVVG